MSETKLRYRVRGSHVIAAYPEGPVGSEFSCVLATCEDNADAARIVAALNENDTLREQVRL